MAGYAPFGRLAFGVIPPENSKAVRDPFSSLTLDPDLELQYLVELYPYDPEFQFESLRFPSPIGGAAFGQINVRSKGGINMICLADQHFITEPDDILPNRYFMPVINNPLQFDVSILRGETLGIGALSFGAIEIQNGDGSLDHLARMKWKGRRIVVKAGRRGWRYGLFVPVFEGLINGLELSDRIITITFRDLGLRLEKEIEAPSYLGTGGLEGGADNAGKLKPLLYGQALNIEPVLVDAMNLVYQIHSGSMESVEAVYDAGVELEFLSDVTDITAVTPGAGQYSTQLSAGLIKLGSTPSGRITADAKGDNAGGYVDRIADIARRIVMTRIGSESFLSGEIDNPAFDRLNLELSGAAGLYIQDRSSIRSFLDKLINPCGAYWYFNRVGLLTCDYVDVAGLEEAIITENFIDAAGIEAPVPITASWRISVGYAAAWVVQKEDELAGAASESRRAFVGQDFRLSTSENPIVRELDPHALERTFNTLLVHKEDADALLERLVRIYGQDRNIYRVPVYGALYRNYLGDSLRLTYPRYSIDKTFSVVGISENAERGQTIMELWG